MIKNNKIILQVNSLVKKYPGVTALKNVDFDLRSGEIHGLIGENGAGKSTLAKIISGIEKPDSGEMFVDGVKVNLNSVVEGRNLGVDIAHQELNLTPSLSISENMFLGRELRKRGSRIIDTKTMDKTAGEILDMLGAEINPKKLVGSISPGEKQIVEIARALFLKPKILILDEPTSSISISEKIKIFKILKNIRKEGLVGLIYISHILDEIIDLSDRITVLKDGEKISTLPNENIKKENLINLMIGRDITLFSRSKVKKGDVLLEVNNLSKENVYKDININVRKGEIVGLAGLVGAGRTEVGLSIFGAMEYDNGEIIRFGKKAKRTSVGSSIKNGIVYLPDDRQSLGLCIGLQIKINIIMGSFYRLFKSGFISPKKEEGYAMEFIKKLNIQADSSSKIVKFLSGGNQQKVVFAKCLCSEPAFFILDEPTRGIDVAAKAEIHKLIDDITKSGAGVLLISSELSEIVGMSDRVYVMWKGRITAELSEEKITESEITKYMFGENAQV